jgi:uroporphyrinogen decarboxylase
VRLARQGVLTPDEYAEFGRPYDLQVLQAVRDAPFNLLHICGPQAYFSQVADYPVHAINWAAVGQGNPTLAEARQPTDLAVIGGVDENDVIQHGRPEEVIAAARAALQSTGGRHVLLTPGCGVALDVPAANLHALRRAVEIDH